MPVMLYTRVVILPSVCTSFHTLKEENTHYGVVTTH
jgi:hypothetical protein